MKTLGTITDKTKIKEIPIEEMGVEVSRLLRKMEEFIGREFKPADAAIVITDILYADYKDMPVELFYESCRHGSLGRIHEVDNGAAYCTVKQVIQWFDHALKIHKRLPKISEDKMLPEHKSTDEDYFNTLVEMIQQSNKLPIGYDWSAIFRYLDLEVTEADIAKAKQEVEMGMENELSEAVGSIARQVIRGRKSNYKTVAKHNVAKQYMVDKYITKRL